MIRPCDIAIVCDEFPGSSGAGANDNPLLNLSAEGPEPIPVPPTGTYWTREAYCCNGLRKFVYSEISEQDAIAALASKVANECKTCYDGTDQEKHCANVVCPDKTVLSKICITGSQAQADKLAAAEAALLAPYCPDHDNWLYKATCACPDGSGAREAWAVTAQQAQDRCESGLDCPGHGKDGGNQEDKGGPTHDPTPPVHPPKEHPITPGIIPNEEQKCTVYCPDGLPFTKTVAAGKYTASTQADANALAKAYACSRAAIEKICLGDLNEVICKWQGPNTFTISIVGDFGPYEVDIVGALPEGMDWEVTDNGYQITISGTPTEAGEFDFTFIAGDALGNAQVKDYVITVVGIDDQPQQFKDRPINVRWTKAFSLDGPWAADAIIGFVGNIPGVTWSLPPGGGGLLDGFPTVPGRYLFHVMAQDDLGHYCDNVYEIVIVDCAHESYDQDFYVGGPCACEASSRIDLPIHACSWPAHVISDRLDLCCNCYSGGTITVKLYNYLGQLQATDFAAATGPNCCQISNYHTIPAQYEDYERPWYFTITVATGTHIPGCV